MATLLEQTGQGDDGHFTYAQPYPDAGRLPRWLAPLAPADPQRRAALRLAILRIIIAINLFLGTFYVAWRYAGSINWQYWWVAIPLIIAETYSLVDAWLFGITMWNWRGKRPAPPPPPPVRRWMSSSPATTSRSSWCARPRGRPW